MPGTLDFTQPANGILSTTLLNYRKTMVNNIVLQIPLFFWLHEKKRKRLIDGGQRIIVPLLYGLNTTVASYSAYGTLDTTPQEGMTVAEYNWKQYAGTLSISRKERRQNSGEDAVINLVEAKAKQLEISLQEQLEEDALKATPGADDLDSVDTLVGTGTVGGIAGATLTFWQSTVTASGSFAGQGLSDMRTGYNTVSKGNDAPDLGLSTQTVFEYYENTLQPQQRFTNTKLLDGGFQSLMFKGMAMTWSEKVISGYLYMLNSKYLSLDVDKETDFVTTPFIEPTNQDAATAKLLFMGNLTCSNRKRQFKMTGITA